MAEDMAERGVAVRSRAETEPALRPLVIDLDGTLLRTNILIACALAYMRREPLALLHILFWLFEGLPRLKQELACRALVDPMLLPLDPALSAFIAAERARGRRIYVAIAADAGLARAVAAGPGPFGEVLASDGVITFKGRRKAEALAGLFR